MDKKRLDALDDDDIPVVENPESIKEWEEKNGRGFWGNATTGHVNDADNK